MRSEPGLSSNAYRPASLFFYQPFTNHNQVVVLNDPTITDAPVIRQIRTPQALVDIVPDTAHSFELRFYQLIQVSTNVNAGSGYYDILTNAPFVLWRFSNPDQDPEINRRLRITEARPGITYTNDVEYNPTNQTWSLIRGSGSEQYRETRALAFQTNIVESSTNISRFETNKIADGAGKVAFHVLERYDYLTWGWELAYTVVDPATNALTTTFAYYPFFYVDEPYFDPADTKLKRIINPDGSWEERDYEFPFDQSSGPPVLSKVCKQRAVGRHRYG